MKKRNNLNWGTSPFLVKMELVGDYKFEVLSMLGNPANKKAHAEGEVRQGETGISTALTEVYPEHVEGSSSESLN
jgi:hypothetical protein